MLFGYNSPVVACFTGNEVCVRQFEDDRRFEHDRGEPTGSKVEAYRRFIGNTV